MDVSRGGGDDTNVGREDPELYLVATAQELLRLRLTSLDAEWIDATWDSQFTECGALPDDYEADVLNDHRAVVNILKKVRTR